MKFLKYRHKFGTGGSQRWDYLLLSLEDEVSVEEVEAVVAGVEHQYNWSEHYRGLEYKVVDKPTPEWLDKDMEMTRHKLLYHRKRLEAFIKLKEGMRK